MITLATEKLFGHGEEDDVSVMAWRSFKLQRKIAGSNNGETQALAFADESLWLVRFAWSEMHGASMRHWHLDETVRQVGGMLITDSRGIFDALTRSESPQLRLRSSRTCEEARGMCCDGIVLGQETMEMHFDFTFESGPLFNQEDLDDQSFNRASHVRHSVAG